MKTAVIHKTGHASFSRKLKVYFDEDIRELVETLKTARKALFIHGYNPEEIDNVLKKWEV